MGKLAYLLTMDGCLIYSHSADCIVSCLLAATIDTEVAQKKKTEHELLAIIISSVAKIGRAHV